MKVTVNSKWSHLRGIWDEAAGEYINEHTTSLPDKPLQVCIIKRPGQPNTLQFFGGPTGFEAYHLTEKFIKWLTEHDTLCLCAGTINSWPVCEVATKDVLEALDKLTQAHPWEVCSVCGCNFKYPDIPRQYVNREVNGVPACGWCTALASWSASSRRFFLGKIKSI